MHGDETLQDFQREFQTRHKLLELRLYQQYLYASHVPQWNHEIIHLS